MTDYIQANTNGRLHDAREPSIAPLDRGFLYGDAIYEVARTYHGVLFAVEEHWNRLQRSAAALHLPVGLSKETLLDEIRRTAAAFRQHTQHAGELYVRLQITRGGGAIGLDVALAEQTLWILLVQRLKIGVPAAGRNGLRLSVARELQRNSPATLNPAWKTGNYLNNLLCLREARGRGADEVVILNAAGAVTEAAVCNIAFVQNSAIVTPPAAAGILEGVTRDLLLREIARRAGIGGREQTIAPADFPRCSECFLTSTTRDVAAVEAIDEHRFHVGPETVTARLKQAFAAYAAAYAETHPELRL